MCALGSLRVMPVISLPSLRLTFCGVVLDGLRRVRDGAVVAEHVFGDAQLVVAEAGVPGVQDFLFMLHA